MLSTSSLSCFWLQNWKNHNTKTGINCRRISGLSMWKARACYSNWHEFLRRSFAWGESLFLFMFSLSVSCFWLCKLGYYISVCITSPKVLKYTFYARTRTKDQCEVRGSSLVVACYNNGSPLIIWECISNPREHLYSAVDGIISTVGDTISTWKNFQCCVTISSVLWRMPPVH